MMRAVIFIDDPLGLFNISLDGIRQRDKLVIETITKLNLPLLTFIGGGYDKTNLNWLNVMALLLKKRLAI